MKKKRGIFALLVVALVITGVAVAIWIGNIRFRGTTHMASMTLVFDNSEPLICTEFHVSPENGQLMLGELCGENVGETTCRYQGVITDPRTENWGYEDMTITINNAYPSYRVHVTFTVHNIGSIPVDISEFVITDPTGALTWDNMQGALVDDNDKPIININHVDLVGKRIGPCTKVKSEFHFLIMHDAQEGDTYSFEIEIVYTQWGQTVNPGENWEYYREVEISTDHPENYPILVNLPFAADNSIRFLENFDGTKDDIRESDFLSYWVDSDNNQRVWVRRLDNFTSREGSDNAIYCLYENPLATPMSSGENTFTYWKTENFLTDWNIVSGDFSESSGILSSAGDGKNLIIADSENYGPRLLYEGKMRLKNILKGGSVDVVLGYVDDNNCYMGELWDYGATNNLRLYKRVGGNDVEIITSNWTRDTNWHVIGVRWENTTRLDLYYDYGYINVSDNGNSAFTGGSFGFVMNKTPRQADWFRIRKFIYPEPTAYAGAEQTIQ